MYRVFGERHCGERNVTTVNVTCAAAYTIGGTVSGLSGTGLVLQDNGSDNLTISGNGIFAFATPIFGGGAYSVTVQTQPTAQLCDVSLGTGIVGSSNVTTVTVTCQCGRAITSILSETSPYSSAVTITYDMVAGGGGAGGGNLSAPGGGGASTAILSGTTQENCAAGGAGGSAGVHPGLNGTAFSGSFSLAAGANLTIDVGGGGGGGGYDDGGGGASGYFGGGGGGYWSGGVGGGGGGCSAGGVGGGSGATSGSSLTGGHGSNNMDGARVEAAVRPAAAAAPVAMPAAEEAALVAGAALARRPARRPQAAATGPLQAEQGPTPGRPPQLCRPRPVPAPRPVPMAEMPAS